MSGLLRIRVRQSTGRMGRKTDAVERWLACAGSIVAFYLMVTAAGGCVNPDATSPEANPTVSPVYTLPGGSVQGVIASPAATPTGAPPSGQSPFLHPTQTPTAVPTIAGPPLPPSDLLFSEYGGASWLRLSESKSFTRLGTGDIQSSSAVWSPDGNEIAYIATNREPVVSSEIRIHSVIDGSERVLTGTRFDNPGPRDILRTLTKLEWSGNGRWLIYNKQGLAVVYDLQENEMAEYSVLEVSRSVGVSNPARGPGLGVGPVSKELNDFILSIMTTDGRFVLIRGAFDRPGIFQKIELPAGAFRSIQGTFYVFRHVAWPGSGDIMYVMVIGKDETLIWAYNFPAARWDIALRISNLPFELGPFEYMRWSDDGTQAAVFSFSGGSEFGPGRTRLVFIAADESRNLKMVARREVGGIFPGGWAQMNNQMYFTVWLESPESGVYLVSPVDAEVLIPVAGQEDILRGLEVNTERISNGTWRSGLEIGDWQPVR